MRRLLVNDALSQIPGTRTFWHDLMEWAGAEFVGGPYETLAAVISGPDFPYKDASLIIRNASYFGSLKASARIPTISLLQDIFEDGPMRKMQEEVIKSSQVVVYNSSFTASKYPRNFRPMTPTTCTNILLTDTVIPLPVDFSLFEPGNAMGLQQALSLPDGCVCWIGASQGAAGHVKGYDIFLQIVRLNPDIPFVAVFKDAAPDVVPPNLRCFVRLPQEELVKVIGACRVGLCTSRSETQHLAGIEMGACGLPMVAPPVGTYWKREGMVGVIVEDSSPDRYAMSIRTFMHHGTPANSDFIRAYWQKEFDKPIIKAAWTKLIEEVECRA